MTVWGHPFMVRIHYPGRKGKRGKRDLVKGMPSHGAAVIYAKQVAGRGPGKGGLWMGAWRGRPVACVYDVKSWNAAPECYAARPPESGKSPGYYTRGETRVRRVPYFGGYSRRRRRRH